ncbi:LysE family translocator [Poseidonibacter ostreae]|jgi:threonine/homoserine/homoserine lactone efflux protein|uniref:LysE family translocator n=1 Tax=Poseidonibacter ostreae TaxID=2654171 RepID=A0A6L4WVS7_9BACT|nr:LysE family translocator [Poseidonibacter ostreae]KAB7886851.1 LysE family translocator [Poseidonibacter ostreae]KAB7890494.1 LysE family translocator [Poseidonibacter ostreae]KAB7890913.1 LysE family translocator [Poseidonibacter ostreae]MAC83130.1 lysine transporter LysE [Arcobacter sp.]|tara:strand:+ start:11032 stop:11664 length:633 start_codon:yes stop_codon:yes gene_type:complete
MNIDTLLIYTVVAFFYITSPGPAIVLAIINGMRTNMKTVMITSFANVLGLFILSSASILGLGVLFKTSSNLFLLVKIVGAFYLIYLGFKFLFNRSSFKIDDNCQKEEKKSKKSYFLESFFLAITNPKPILFFTAIFPQFLDMQNNIIPQFFILTGIFLFISFTSLCLYAYLAKKSKKWLSNKNRLTWFSRITGGMFIGLGVGILQLKNSN